MNTPNLRDEFRTTMESIQYCRNWKLLSCRATHTQNRTIINIRNRRVASVSNSFVKIAIRIRQKHSDKRGERNAFKRLTNGIRSWERNGSPINKVRDNRAKRMGTGASKSDWSGSGFFERISSGATVEREVHERNGAEEDLITATYSC